MSANSETVKRARELASRLGEFAEKFGSIHCGGDQTLSTTERFDLQHMAKDAATIVEDLEGDGQPPKGGS